MKKHNNHLYQVIKIEHFLSVMPVYPMLLKLEVPHVDQEARHQRSAQAKRISVALLLFGCCFVRRCKILVLARDSISIIYNIILLLMSISVMITKTASC